MHGSTFLYNSFICMIAECRIICNLGFFEHFLVMTRNHAWFDAVFVFSGYVTRLSFFRPLSFCVTCTSLAFFIVENLFATRKITKSIISIIVRKLAPNEMPSSPPISAKGEEKMHCLKLSCLCSKQFSVNISTGYSVV